MSPSISRTSAADALPGLPGFLFIDHFAVSVLPGELERQVEAYSLMGFKEVHREEIFGKDQVREVLMRIGNSPNLLQLVEPVGDDSPVMRQIERNGGRGGLIHVGFRVEDVQTAFDCLSERGFRIIDRGPRLGSRGTLVFFLHPRFREDQTFGVLYEIVEDPQDPVSAESSG